MREFRTVYNVPYGVDRFSKPGNVLGRIHVLVQPCSALTGEAMPLPFSDIPTHRTRLARIGGVDLSHAQPGYFGLIETKSWSFRKAQRRNRARTRVPTLIRARRWVIVSMRISAARTRSASWTRALLILWFTWFIYQRSRLEIILSLRLAARRLPLAWRRRRAAGCASFAVPSSRRLR